MNEVNQSLPGRGIGLQVWGAQLHIEADVFWATRCRGLGQLPLSQCGSGKKQCGKSDFHNSPSGRFQTSPPVQTAPLSLSCVFLKEKRDELQARPASVVIAAAPIRSHP